MCSAEPAAEKRRRWSYGVLYMLDSIYNQIYFIGLQTIRIGKRLGRWIFTLLSKPVKALVTLLISAVVVTDKLALKAFHEIMGDFKELFGKVKKVSADMSASENSRASKGARLKAYFLLAFKTYRRAFVYVLNILLPVLSLALLVYVIGSFSDVTLGLEITYNGEVIGYVSSEAEYKQARQQALERLDISVASAPAEEDGEEKQLIGQADYKIKPVKLSQISDSSVICDKLIEKSDSKITNACGIYVDNAFVCAVKNETDALSVFDGILAEYETDEENAAVSFVEDIEYVQGLYPDDGSIVRDAAYLNEVLHSKKSEAQYYTVEAGDTVSQIAQRFDMTTTQIFNLNPSLKENIYIGQKILLSSEVNFVRVQITKTEKRTVEIPYDTVKVNTSSLYVGDQRTVVKGVNGLEEVTELVTYIDGVRVSSKEVSRTTVREAVDEKIQVGTKQNYFGSSTGGSVVSYGGRLLWPAIGATSISSPYGPRSLGGWHGGMDIVRPGGSLGCAVVAAESGTVTFAGWYGSGGYTVMINHGNGLSTLYAHMQQGSLTVSAGQRVSRGQQIGRIGATGYVTGPHLHFEVRVNGTKVNPAKYLGR